MHRNDIRNLRTQLRELNIEYSALVRMPGEANPARMDELRTQRRLLMASIAEQARAYPASAPLNAVGQAA